VINNRVTLAQLARQTSGLFEVGPQIGKTTYVAWAVKKGNRALLDFLNAFIKEQYASGTIAELWKKYDIPFAEMPSRPVLPGGRPLR